ncbi:hypothetical protein ACFVX6_11010 [Streptomyces sp. NPDC058289]|uniref:hypothetical protein n=1 Tax=Streptomyces sp. NPDC058289 TaxID=3346425 RepID=UPI0036EBAC91
MPARRPAGEPQPPRRTQFRTTRHERGKARRARHPAAAYTKEAAFVFWTVPASELPIGWAEAERRLAEQEKKQAQKQAEKQEKGQESERG